MCTGQLQVVVVVAYFYICEIVVLAGFHIYEENAHAFL